MGLLSLYSPAKLIVVDRRSSQREASLRMGATHYLAEGESNVREEINEITGERGADIAFEAAGHPDAVRNAVDATGRGGKVILAGIAGTDQASSLDPDEMVFKDLRVEGVFAYPSRAFGKVVELIDTGLLDVRPLITHRFPLSRAQEALELLRNGNEPSTKIMLEPESESA
jgi:threonine dehydrogenase-like Zn-dependent dehydrogenase